MNSQLYSAKINFNGLEISEIGTFKYTKALQIYNSIMHLIH